MVSAYDDAGQAAWASGAGIEVLRGAGRLDGPGRVRVGDETYTARHVVHRHRVGRRSSRRSPACRGSTACGPTARRPG